MKTIKVEMTDREYELYQKYKSTSMSLRTKMIFYILFVVAQAASLTTFWVLTSIWSFKVTLSRSFIMYDLKENSVKNTLCTELHPSAYASWKRKGIQWGLNTNPLFLFLPFGSYIMRQRYIKFSISQTFHKNYSIVALSKASITFCLPLRVEAIYGRITSTSEWEVICAIKSSSIP